MADQSEWVSLSEAAKLLGVHPTTVRNWADQGSLPFRRTPGKHRRFQRSTLEQWAEENRLQVKPASGGHSAEFLMEYALGHTRFGLEEDDIHQKGWYAGFSPQGIDQLRRYGRRILEAILRHIKDQAPEGEEFTEAHQLGRDYADLLKNEGLTLAQAIQGFMYFDDFLVESVVQMMAPNMSASPSEWSDLMRQINAFTNEMLVALTNHYQGA
jgi:excisionase family DNA binding protein